MTDGMKWATGCAVGLLWAVALWLMVRSTIDTELVVLRAWGVTLIAAASVSTVCAMIHCAASKVLRAVHRAQLEELLKVRL